ncbi:MAG TPA: UDP-N-acetylmuramate dehydrogenase [Acidimicrobiales bacterium]|nr:UDP-N-acetylmuramate dehydrogenase [Acidimicrobiales bacterium]
MTRGPEAVERAAALLGGRARRDVALGPFTTYKVGGPAALLVQAGSARDLAAVADAVAAGGLAVLVVGKGSNLLVSEAGFDGVAVVLGDGFAGVDIDGTRVRAGGAAALPVVARQTVRASLTGFEWAVGVPGSIGGAVRMNAGGHGSDMAATLIEAEIVDLAGGGAARTVPAADLALGYRRSAVAPAQVVVTATLGLAVGDRAAGERTISEIVAWRRANQPGGQNAGSVFTNPPGDSAGRLIDVSGCKGLRHGTASVSTKHANFFQADSGGSADDVWALMGEVRRRVAEATGVELVPETRLVGFGNNSRAQVESLDER